MAIEASIISDWLDSQADAMLTLLRDLVNIDSGSYDKAGVDAVGMHLTQFFREFDIDVETFPIDGFGDILRASSGPVKHTAGRVNYLMMGHRDTVFDQGEAARRPFNIRGGCAYGPGVADMKGGLVMNAFVMAAFHKFAPEVPLVFLMTGDEEIGSETSREHIEAEATTARAVFNSEPGRVSGNIVTGRKGSFCYHFTIQGKAAHAGVNYSDGINAVAELAHKTLALQALTEVEEGITLNVGLVQGGSTSNTIPQEASGELDVRFINNKQRDALIQAIDAIMATSFIPGTETDAVRSGDFLPLVPTTDSKKLATLYTQIAQQFGCDIVGEFTGGCADSGFSASVGAPTLCGLGPVGGKMHTEDEYLEVASLSQRASILALTIEAIANSREFFGEKLSE